MYLIADEMIREDCHDPNNALQWDYILLTLPGTREYKPDLAWISKRRADGLLVSDYVSFVGDLSLRIVAEGQKRVAEIGHMISTQESYVGLQDALRKLRFAGRTRRPGA